MMFVLLKYKQNDQCDIISFVIGCTFNVKKNEQNQYHKKSGAL